MVWNNGCSMLAEAMTYFVRAVKEGLYHAKDGAPLASAALYVSARLSGHPRLFQEIAVVSSVPVKVINRWQHEICEKLSIFLPMIRPHTLVARLCQPVGMSQRMIEYCRQTCIKLEQSEVVDISLTPQVIACSAIMLTSTWLSRIINQSDISPVVSNQLLFFSLGIEKLTSNGLSSPAPSSPSPSSSQTSKLSTVTVKRMSSLSGASPASLGAVLSRLMPLADQLVPVHAIHALRTSSLPLMAPKTSSTSCASSSSSSSPLMQPTKQSASTALTSPIIEKARTRASKRKSPFPPDLDAGGRSIFCPRWRPTPND